MYGDFLPHHSSGITKKGQDENQLVVSEDTHCLAQDRNDNILVLGAGMWHSLWSVTAVLHFPGEPQELNIKGIAWPWRVTQSQKDTPVNSERRHI